MSTEINELVTKLNDLVLVLKDSKRSSGGGGGGETSSDKSINKLIIALGKVALKIDESIRGAVSSKKEERQALKKFTDVVNRTSDVQERYAKKIQQEKKEREDAAKLAIMTDKERAEFNKKQHAEELRQAQDRKIAAMKEKSASQDVWESYKDLGGASEVLKDNFFKLGGNSMLAQGGLRLFAAGLEGAVAATESYIKAVYSGDRGMTVVAKSFTELVKPLNNFAEIVGLAATALVWLTPLGKIARVVTTVLGAGLTKALTGTTDLFLALNEAAAKQFDDLIKSFQTISDVGATATGGIGEVRDLIHTLNLSVSELEKFNTMVTTNGKNFVLMGATALDGVRKFAYTAGTIVTGELGEQMRLMGMTNDDIRDATLAYMTSLAKAGQLEQKSRADLLRGTKEFVNELDLAAKLTGASRKKQQEALAFANADARLRAAQYRARNDPQETIRLQNMRAAGMMLHAMGDTEAATGFYHSAAGRGAVTSEQGVIAEMGFRASELYGKTAQLSQIEIFQFLAKAQRDTEEMVGDLVTITGNLPPFMSSSTGSETMYDLITRDDQLKKIMAMAPEEAQDALATFFKGRETTKDDDTKNILNAGQNMQNTAIAFDKTVATFAHEFGLSTKVYDEATKTFAQAIIEFNKILNPSSTAVSLSNDVSTASDIGGGQTMDEVYRAVGAAVDLPSVDSPSTSKPNVPVKPSTSPSSLSSSTISRSSAYINLRRQGVGAREAYEIAKQQLENFGRSGSSVAVSSSPRDLIAEMINFGSGSGGQTSLNMLDERLLDSLVLAARDLYTNTNKKITITSSYRSKEDQEALYNQRVETLKNGIGILPNGLPVAPPGRSMHEKGKAIDVGNYNDPDVLKYLNMYGLVQNVRNDPVHFVKAANGALIQPTPGGSLVQAGEAGKAEAVIPMPDGKTIPVTLTNSNEQYAKLNYQFEMMNDKFESIIDLLSSSNRIQDNIARNFV